MSHDDPLAPHSHEPNPEPPSADPAFTLEFRGRVIPLTVDHLRQLPSVAIDNCFIVSTGHGTSGPFSFAGVPLLALVDAHDPGEWTLVEVISADGFGTRLGRAELLAEQPARASILAHAIDGRPMTRAEGLARLIVPSERDDALKQVKWVATVRVK